MVKVIKSPTVRTTVHRFIDILTDSIFSYHGAKQDEPLVSLYLLYNRRFFKKFKLPANSLKSFKLPANPISGLKEKNTFVVYSNSYSTAKNIVL